MVDEDINDNWMDGWHAHRLGVFVQRNPFSEDTQHYSHAQWDSGWCARFETLKRGGSLRYDNYLP